MGPAPSLIRYEGGLDKNVEVALFMALSVVLIILFVLLGTNHHHGQKQQTLGERQGRLSTSLDKDLLHHRGQFYSTSITKEPQSAYGRDAGKREPKSLPPGDP